MIKMIIRKAYQSSVTAKDERFPFGKRGRGNAKGRPVGGGLRRHLHEGADLFDLGFLEGDMLADDRVVLAELQLVRGLAGVLLLDIEVPGAGRAHQPDQNGILFRHDLNPSVPGNAPVLSPAPGRQSGQEDTAARVPVKPKAASPNPGLHRSASSVIESCTARW